MTVPEENRASIRLRVDQPASGAQLSVDEHGKIAINGVLHKHASMVDVSDKQVATSDFTIGPPPDDVAAWAVSWTTSMRPPHLGANQLCTRAKRDPHRSARILRSFTVVDLIPPSTVPDLAISNISATGAKATWGTATDNYGLAGYVVTVDGGAAHRTTVGTRSFTITGLTPSTPHTVSVVAIDLAGNTSTTPATASFTTDAEVLPPSGDFTFDPHENSALASWHPTVATDVTYRASLDGEHYDEFPLEQYCVDASGNPASPCTAQDVISYPIGPLEDGTPYTFQIDALRADGTRGRSLSGSFTTKTNTVPVAPETVQEVASESSRCAGMGGDFYVGENVRALVPIPGGSTQVFPGCYNVPDHSCLDAFLPPSGDKVLKCADDLTRLLFSMASPGRGPVITSLNDIVPAAAASGPTSALLAPSLVEPIVWCIEEGSCTVLVEDSLLAAALVQAGPVVGAGTSALVLTAEGIGLGVGLFAILEILFPGQVSLDTFFEYPIHFDDNFDTFDNWGLDQGRWYNNLKMFAEVVKTTNQLAARNGIPFAWNVSEDQELKSMIDIACAAQRGTFPFRIGCNDDDVAVYVPGSQNYKFQPMDETGKHIVAALGDGGVPAPPSRATWFYPARSKRGQAAKNAGFSRDWYNTLFKPNDCDHRAGKTCDEFPFWTTNQAVNLSGMVASLKPVPGAETNPQRDDVGGFYSKCRVDDTHRFIVLPVKPWVEAGGPSFGFRVTKSGASLCMAPGL